MERETVDEWLTALIADPAYQVTYSPWVETGDDGGQRYCVIGTNSGVSPSEDVRRKNYNLFLLGPINSPGESTALLALAEYIVTAIVGESQSMPCGAAMVSVMNEPIGPALTSDNRAWVQINLQITF